MIAVDWGSSSLRIYRVDDQGRVLDRRRSSQGVLACDGRFSEVLAEQIRDWDDTVIVLSGMIGSRNGWREVPYLECPAGLQDLAGAMLPLTDHGIGQAELWLVPGLSYRSHAGVFDVMRGEETQIVGLPEVLLSGTHQVCLPGTHSKWATLQDGRIRHVSTSMTGEMYALLRQHSILGKLMAEGSDVFAEKAFDEGLRRSGDTGGWLHHLFGVRTMGLFDRYADSELPSYLSGLLIGHEIRNIDRSRSVPRPLFMHVIGSDQLRTSYTHAFAKLGIGVLWHHEDRVVVGLHRLAMMAGLITH